MVKYDIKIFMKTAVRNIVDPPRINLVSNDHNGNEFDFTIYHDNRVVMDLTGKRVTLIVKSPSGAIVQDFCNVTNAEQGKASITLKTSMFQEAGEYYVEVQVYDDNSRATSAPFNYTVRRALDANEIVVTSNEFSVLQEALINVDAANANAAEALSTANNAKAIADDLVPKVTQAATDAQTALDRALSVVTQEDLSEKVKINNTPQNVNFIRNEIVKDGLVSSKLDLTNKSMTFSSVYNGTLHFSLEFMSNNYASASSDSLFYLFGFGVNPTFYLNSSDNANVKLGEWHKLDVTVTSEGATVNIDGKLYKKINIKPQTNTLSIGNYGETQISLGSVTFIKNVLVYNRQLTPTEIQHNFSVLNNTPSINKINDKSLATDTYHVQVSTGITTEERYTGLLKTMCKEFTSDGSKINVNNGIPNQKILSGKIEGQTVKNCVLGRISEMQKASGTVDAILNSNDNTLTLEGIGTSGYISQCAVEPNKQYTFVWNILKNTMTESIQIFTVGVSNRPFTPKIDLPVGFTGIFKKLVTSKSEFTDNTIALYQNIETGGECIIQGYLLLEGDWTGVSDTILANMCKGMTGGLNSTKAIISNNGMKYSFYKDATDKASGTIIDLGGLDGARNTLEIKEDGSAIYTQNTDIYKFDGINEGEWYYFGTTTSGLFRFYNNRQIKSNSQGMCDKLPFISGVGSVTNIEGVGSHTSLNRTEYVIDSSKLTTKDVAGFKVYLQSNPFIVRYQLATPIVTTIPRELVPTILTQATNTFQFGEAVAPTSVTIKAPTTDDIAKSYENIVLLNAYTQTVGTAKPVVNLINTGLVRLQMDLTAPTTGMNATLFTLPTELRPVTTQKIPVFVNGVCQLATIDKTTGNVNLASVPSANANIYIKTDYRRDI